jgi:hypothetical protein
VALFSRKVLRRVLPLSFPLLLAASLALAPRHPLYSVAAAVQLAVLGLAVVGWALRKTAVGRSPALYVPLFFCMANLASAVAIWEVVRGRRIELWTPHRHASQAAVGEGIHSLRAG